jgi:small subunit ribosomal protein S11
MVTFSDVEGNVLSWSSSGKLGFKGSKKSTPYAAQQCVEEAAKAAKEYGIKSVEVYVKGPGNGREQAIRSIAACDVEVTLIRDVSPIPHNGCRPPKRRRV